jgi:hypothetical protein
MQTTKIFVFNNKLNTDLANCSKRQFENLLIELYLFKTNLWEIHNSRNKWTKKTSKNLKKFILEFLFRFDELVDEISWGRISNY